MASHALAGSTNQPPASDLPGQAPRRPEFAPPASALHSSTTNLPELKEVSPGILELGKVRLNSAERTVSLPAVLNRAEGQMEYFLVTTYGKVHESILRTDVAPTHIHLAMLLLNAKGAATNSLSSPPREYGGSPGVALTGDPISLEIAWSDQGKTIRCQAEDMVLDQTAKIPMRKGRWVFNGSAMWQGTFLAQQSGSLVSLISDPVALINDLAPAAEVGITWTANPAKLPPPDAPVEVTIRLLGPKPAK
jgi:hypothetical protein